MFDNKGQSALEYLMTYGWALIVIAIVIGVLIFVTSGATGGVTCQSQSTGLVLKEWSVDANHVGITLQNATGGTIGKTSKVTAQGVGLFSALDFNIVNTDNNIPRNATFTVRAATGGPVSTGAFSDAGIDVNYRTEGGLPAQATITCSGSMS